MEEFADLLRGATAKENEAWDKLVGRYAPLVWRLLSRFRSLSRQEKEELSQDTFTVLLEKGLEQFRGTTEHEFRWYIRSIAENGARARLRRHSRRFETLEVEDSGPETGSLLDRTADLRPGPEQLVVGQEIQAQLQCCLQQIELRDQEIFWLRQRGEPYDRIAQILGIPQGTVASSYYRAKEKLENCLKRAGLTW